MDKILGIVSGILKGFAGNIGFDSKKMCDWGWNIFARGFEITYELENGKYKFFTTDRVVSEGDGAIKAGVAEPLDGPAIRKVIVKLAEIVFFSLFPEKKPKTEMEDTNYGICPDCGSEIRKESGCETCTNPSCGWSKC